MVFDSVRIYGFYPLEILKEQNFLKVISLKRVLRIVKKAPYKILKYETFLHDLCKRYLNLVS